MYVSIFIGLFISVYYFLNFLNKTKEEIPKFSEKNPPKVTIVIPAFNEEKGIAGTIESALNINYPKNKLEIIVVDDGSKDDTYKIACGFKNRGIMVLTKPNGGKGAALNLGISKSHGEFIVTMDADNTHVNRDALKNMMAHFNNLNVMCVAPVMVVYNPKGFFQRIQHIEYLLGVFLRKAFSAMNAIHVTPGAFSVYRKKFFDKYGGFDEHNLTEDLEMALRIQFNNYIISNSTEAVIYTVTPDNFIALMKQRRRWYAGLFNNLMNYRKLFSSKFGSMGVIVLPAAIISVLLTLILVPYLLIKSLIDLQKEILFYQSINFDFLGTFEFGKYFFERYFYLMITDPKTIFLAIFLIVTLLYMAFAKSKIKSPLKLFLSLSLFTFFYSLLFAFWWAVSLIYIIFKKNVSWR